MEDKEATSSSLNQNVLSPISTISSSSSKRKPAATMEIVEFKTPADLPKKKRKVLEEDKFVEQLEKIVQRDFFPDLEKLQAQNAYHNAVASNDIHMLRELYSKYSLGATPRLLNKSDGSTPLSFETPTPTGLGMGKTPSSLAAGGEPPSTPTHLPMVDRTEDDSDALSTTSSKKKDPIASMNLNTFLANYTSEDNRSFEEILENADKKHKLKYSWIYEKEKEHYDKFESSSALPSIEDQANYEKPLALDTWKYKNMNYLMYTPDGSPLTADEQVKLARKVPIVNYQNTRFTSAPYKGETTVSSKSSTPSSALFKKPATKIGIDGKEVESETPKVNGFSFVRTPSPTPGVEESPFLTWGEIEGTPFRLDGSDTPIPVDTTIKPYRMLEQTKREQIAMQLQEKVSERYRDRKLKAIETAKHNLTTPKPRSSLDRMSTMSPAARRLMGHQLGNLGSSRDRSLAAAYSPKPPTPKIVTPRSVHTPATPLSHTHTPKTTYSSSSSTSGSQKMSQQKKKASDFF